MQVLKDDISDDQVALDAANMPSVDTVIKAVKLQLLQTNQTKDITIRHEPAAQLKTASNV
jgi:hypothetical protein